MLWNRTSRRFVPANTRTGISRPADVPGPLPPRLELKSSPSNIEFRSMNVKYYLKTGARDEQITVLIGHTVEICGRAARTSVTEPALSEPTAG